MADVPPPQRPKKRPKKPPPTTERADEAQDVRRARDELAPFLRSLHTEVERRRAGGDYGARDVPPAWQWLLLLCDEHSPSPSPSP